MYDPCAETMGSRLTKLKSKLAKTKLSDGKTIGGHGRLTDAAISEIQTYYGLAIRRNVKSCLGRIFSPCFKQ